MNTTSYDNNLLIAETYYQHMLNKDFKSMEQCLHTNVDFLSPLAAISGRSSVVEAAKNLRSMLDDIVIRAKFSAENQIMLAYDFIFSPPIGKLRAAVLMAFKDKLISKIELFYDGRPFDQTKDKIFSKQISGKK